MLDSLDRVPTIFPPCLQNLIRKKKVPGQLVPPKVGGLVFDSRRRQLFFDASQIDSSNELVSDICKS